jgi:hypothetical protein
MVKYGLVFLIKYWVELTITTFLKHENELFLIKILINDRSKIYAIGAFQN